MSEYISSFIVEPVVRQARRLSRINNSEENPRFFPKVPESIWTWAPVKLWNVSPPVSTNGDQGNEHDEASESELLNQWVASVPSPPLEVMDPEARDRPDPPRSNGPTPAPFPPLEPHVAEQARPDHLGGNRNGSDSSINPLRELPDRSRLHEEDVRGHSQSDPFTRVRDDSAGHGSTSSTDMARAYYDNDEQGRLRDGSGTLPEDDGMGPLRKRIYAFWHGEGTVEFKSQELHALMMERYNKSRLGKNLDGPPRHGRSTSGKSLTPSCLRDRDDAAPGSPIKIDSPGGDNISWNLSTTDLQPSFVPVDHEEASPTMATAVGELKDHEGAPVAQLGCMHYARNVKLQCYTCRRWYPCRFCHDEIEDHVLPRQSTENMLCMLCKTPQRASQTCSFCGAQSACYYCSVCKLWNNDPGKSIYHCDDCGICRLGKGLGKDFFHCPTCAVCMSIGAQSTHRCIERSTKCDCPICGEYLFTSSSAIVFMRCGHSIHESCFKDWCRASYKCPMCSKSVINMESQFRSLDRQVESQPMPAEYQNTRAYVYCNDCGRKGTTKYHWLGLKCEICESYNTQQLKLVEASSTGGFISDSHNSNIDTQSDGNSLSIHADNGDDVNAISHSNDPVLSDPPVVAIPSLPQNVSDEAVAIPTSIAVAVAAAVATPAAAATASESASVSSSTAKRRPSSASFSELDSAPSILSSWPPLPAREARSLSPTLAGGPGRNNSTSNYFGTTISTNSAAGAPKPRWDPRSFDFWGRPVIATATGSAGPAATATSNDSANSSAQQGLGNRNKTKVTGLRGGDHPHRHARPHYHDDHDQSSQDKGHDQVNYEGASNDDEDDNDDDEMDETEEEEEEEEDDDDDDDDDDEIDEITLIGHR